MLHFHASNTIDCVFCDATIKWHFCPNNANPFINQRRFRQATLISLLSDTRVFFALAFSLPALCGILSLLSSGRPPLTARSNFHFLTIYYAAAVTLILSFVPRAWLKFEHCGMREPTRVGLMHVSLLSDYNENYLFPLLDFLF